MRRLSAEWMGHLETLLSSRDQALQVVTPGPGGGVLLTRLLQQLAAERTEELVLTLRLEGEGPDQQVRGLWQALEAAWAEDCREAEGEGDAPLIEPRWTSGGAWEQGMDRLLDYFSRMLPPGGRHRLLVALVSEEGIFGAAAEGWAAWVRRRMRGGWPPRLRLMLMGGADGRLAQGVAGEPLVMCWELGVTEADLARALDEEARDPNLEPRARLQTELVQLARSLAGKGTEGLGRCEAFLRRAEALGEPALLAQGYQLRAGWWWQRGEAGEALKDLETAIRLGMLAESPLLVLMLCEELGRRQLELGQVQEAVSFLRLAARLGARLGVAVWERKAAEGLLEALRVAGQREEGEQVARRLEVLGSISGGAS